MAKRSEVIELTEDEIKEAISDWLHNKYGPPKPDMQWRPELKPWEVSITHHPVYDDVPYFTATAKRETG